MRRRDFIETLGMTAALAAVPGALVGATGQPNWKSWTWVHGGDELSSDGWSRRFARLRAAGIEAVLVSGGDPRLLSALARAEGLEFHRWVWILNRSGDEWVKREHPVWFTVSRDGRSSLEKPPYVDYYQWLCPTRPGVRAYLRGIVDELAAQTFISGVHLDYIRHSDVILPVGLWSKYDLVQDREYPEFDFCYCEVCRSTFREQSGVDPLELPDPSRNSEWRRFRWDSVTGLVEILATAVRRHGKPITAAVFPTPFLARKLVRQSWDEWPLDAVFPMLYHGFYEQDIPWIGGAVREGVESLPPTTPLYAGLYLPDLTPPDLAEAVQVARSAGAAGVALFESAGLTDAHLRQLKTL